MVSVSYTLVYSVRDSSLMKKRISYIVGLLIGLLILGVNQLPSDKAKMVVCDVGQGDAILIIKGSNQALIDGGPSKEKILSCLEKYLPFWDHRIELIVLTNTDSDHMEGLSTVVERYDVMHFVTSDGVHSSDALSKFVTKLGEANIHALPVQRGDTIRVEGKHGVNTIEFRVLWPPDTIEQNVAIFSGQMKNEEREQILKESAKRGNLNERSVALLLLEDNKKILLTGDTGDQTEKQLLKYGDLADIDILKVGHHGSKYSSTLEYLQKLKPETAIISVGSKNRYGHPTGETLDRLKSVGAEILRTDVMGSIEIEL